VPIIQHVTVRSYNSILSAVSVVLFFAAAAGVATPVVFAQDAHDVPVDLPAIPDVESLGPVYDTRRADKGIPYIGPIEDADNLQYIGPAHGSDNFEYSGPMRDELDYARDWYYSPESPIEDFIHEVNSFYEFLGNQFSNQMQMRRRIADDVPDSEVSIHPMTARGFDPSVDSGASALCHEDGDARCSETEARAFLALGNIAVNKQACTKTRVKDCTSLAGIRAETLDQLAVLAQRCDCKLVVTGATEDGHEKGAFSHSRGYKYDLSKNKNLDAYIKKNCEASQGCHIGTRADGFTTYTYYADNQTIIYTDEKGASGGSHWDVLVRPPQAREQPEEPREPTFFDIIKKLFNFL